MATETDYKLIEPAASIHDALHRCGELGGFCGADAWEDLRSKLRGYRARADLPVEDRLKILMCVIQRDALGGKGGDIYEWILDAQSQVAQAVARVRVAALLAGDHETVQDVLLLQVAPNRKLPADVRSWALYGLRYAHLVINSACWDTRGGPIAASAQDLHDAKVRQWAAYLIGEFARSGRILSAGAGDGKKPAAPGRQPDPSLAYESCFWAANAEVYRKAEEALETQWGNEIDRFVQEEIIHALAWVGGYAYTGGAAGDNAAGGSAATDSAPTGSAATDSAATHSPIKFNVQEVLCSAAQSRFTTVWAAVPATVATIALEARTRTDLYNTAKFALLASLNEVLAGCSARHAPRLDHATLANTQDYNDHRSLLLAAATVTTVSAALVYDENLKRSAAPCASQGILQIMHLCNTHVQDGSAAIAARALTTLSDLLLRPNQFVDGLAGNELEGTKARIRTAAGVLHVRRLLALLAEESDVVAANAADLVVALLGNERAGMEFANVILNDGSASELAAWPQPSPFDAMEVVPHEEGRATRVPLLRRRAAEAIARIPGGESESAYRRLVGCLYQDENTDEYMKAEQAFRSMTGAAASSALVGANHRKWVGHRFFDPITRADEHGVQVLDKIVAQSNDSFRFTSFASAVMVLAGAVLCAVSVRLLLIDAPDWKTISTAISGLLASLTGYFIRPGEAVRAANTESARVVTAFHGYMAQMRLLGLGFASAYSGNTADKKADTAFLTHLMKDASTAAAAAATLMKGAAPQGDPLAVLLAPPMQDMSWDEAALEARNLGLTLDCADIQASDKTARGHVASQEPVAGAPIHIGEGIRVILSSGPAPTTGQAPALATKSWSAAHTLAKEHGFALELGKVKGEGGEFEPIVVSQTPKEGAPMAVGDAIVVVVEGTPPAAAAKPA